MACHPTERRWDARQAVLPVSMSGAKTSTALKCDSGLRIK